MWIFHFSSPPLNYVTFAFCSYYTSTLYPSSSPRPMKRPRLQQQQQQVLAPSGRLINGIPGPANGHQQQNGHHHPHQSHMNGSSPITNGIMGDEGGHPYAMANFFQNGSGPPSLNGHHHHPPPSVPSLSFKVYSKCQEGGRIIERTG